jgi:hypothetical protein
MAQSPRSKPPAVNPVTQLEPIRPPKDVRQKRRKTKMSRTTASSRWTLTGKMRMTRRHTRKRRRMKKDPRHSHLRTRRATQPPTTSWKRQVLHNDLHLCKPRLTPQNDRLPVRRQHLRREGNCPSRAGCLRLRLHRPNRSLSQYPVLEMKKRRVKQMTTSYEDQLGKNLDCIALGAC